MATVITVEGVSADQVIKLCASQGWSAKPAKKAWTEIAEEPLLLITLLAFAVLVLLFAAYLIASIFIDVNEVVLGGITLAVGQITGTGQAAKSYTATRTTYAQTGYQPSAPQPPNPP